MSRALACTAVAAVTLVLAPATAAAPPVSGLLVTGRSLGGVALGASAIDVQRAWGARFGRCRNCATQTWYFTYRPFRPEGVGVELRAGRVVAAFTLWSPDGWRTERGLRLGESPARATELYGPLLPVECGTYRALTLRSARAVTAFYVLDERIWGFGLLRPGAPVCR
jgi:hypothetical protein